MRRAAWIFLASIFLPSLALAWLAIHSAQDQRVVLEHQQVIISQNITDALAKNIQARMDQFRSDFAKTTQQLLDENPTPQALAENFNHKLVEAWPVAEIGFAVNVDGDIYSPKTHDGAGERTFRDENDRFLSNRENVEVYSSNSSSQVSQSGQGASSGGSTLTARMSAPSHAADRPKALPAPASDSLESAKDKADLAFNQKEAARPAGQSTLTGAASATPPQNKASDLDLLARGGGAASAGTNAVTEPSADSASASPVPAAPATPVAVPTPPPAAATPATTTASVPAETAATSPPRDESFRSSLGTAAQGSFSDGSSSQNANTNAPLSSAGIANTFFSKIQRNVIPQQALARESAAISNSVPEASDFRRVIGTETSGELARFLENKLRLIVWSHATTDAPIVFGAQLNLAKVIEALRASFQIPEVLQSARADSSSRTSAPQYCVAILNDTGRPAALSIEGFSADWKHPFVATEIGDVLPHWEAALYLVDPEQFNRAARTLQWTLALIVLVLVAAIVAGGSIIATDVRRQVRLAQQKTDFVSNVSHELKTPLTSIRMFADLLAEKRVPDEERQATYLRIIAAEAARLTRLINNVLDFARLERGKIDGQPTAEPRPCDLVDAVRDVVETCAPHLEAEGIAFRHEVEAESLPIRGDLDALAQIILNLISNAEKYGGQDILVRVRRQDTAAGALGCVDVLDRGAGIPARDIKTVFEPFHRLDDSLASGIPGSGLGLTLARRMARAHGGDVTYSARAGGGSCFTLTLPLSPTA
jgi:signal transduction histidine kinase